MKVIIEEDDRHPIFEMRKDTGGKRWRFQAYVDVDEAEWREYEAIIEKYNSLQVKLGRIYDKDVLK